MSTELLKKVYLFEGLSTPELVTVLKACKLERFEQGKFIFLEGDPGDRCYVIEEGEVRISKHIPNFGEETLAVLREGRFFGEMSLIDGTSRSATAIADKPTVCLVIGKHELDNLISEDTVLGVKILRSFCRTLSRKLRETNERIANFIKTTAGLSGPV